MKKIKFILLALLAVILLSGSLYGGIGEEELKRQGRSFLHKLLADNPGKGAQIRKAMGGILRRGDAGISLLDKFALFMYDSKKSGLVMKKVKFFSNGRSISMFIVLRDISDSRLYTLFVEYKYLYSRHSYSLGEIYFSSVFMQRMRAVKRFFGGD